MRLSRLVIALSLAGCGSTLPSLPELDDEDTALPDDPSAEPPDASAAPDAGRRDTDLRDAGPIIRRDAAVDVDATAPAADAGRDSAVGTSACARLPRCASDARATGPASGTPYGRLSVQAVTVTYSVGSVSTTNIEIEGQVRGGTLTLSTRLPSDGSNETPVVRAGVYSAEFLVARRPGNTEDACKAEIPVFGTIVITAHEASAMPTENEAIRLQGQLQITSPGWAILLDFEQGRTCGTDITF